MTAPSVAAAVATMSEQLQQRWRQQRGNEQVDGEHRRFAQRSRSKREIDADDDAQADTLTAQVTQARALDAEQASSSTSNATEWPADGGEWPDERASRPVDSRLLLTRGPAAPDAVPAAPLQFPPWPVGHKRTAQQQQQQRWQQQLPPPSTSNERGARSPADGEHATAFTNGPLGEAQAVASRVRAEVEARARLLGRPGPITAIQVVEAITLADMQTMQTMQSGGGASDTADGQHGTGVPAPGWLGVSHYLRVRLSEGGEQAFLRVHDPGALGEQPASSLHLLSLQLGKTAAQPLLPFSHDEPLHHPPPNPPPPASLPSPFLLATSPPPPPAPVPPPPPDDRGGFLLRDTTGYITAHLYPQPRPMRPEEGAPSKDMGAIHSPIAPPPVSTTPTDAMPTTAESHARNVRLIERPLPTTRPAPP